MDAFVEDIGNLFNAISELLQNYTGTEEEVSLLQELNQKQDAYISELISSSYITTETKNELVANQEVYKTISNDLIAESTGEDGYDTGSGMANQAIQKNKELQASIDKAEDEVFVGEAQSILNDHEKSVAFWETIEKLEEIYEFLQQCNSEDWASYQDKGIVPYCLWRDAEVANEYLYSGSDLPYLSGLADGAYIEVDGVLKLPKLLKDLGNGMQQLIYSFTVAYIECNPMAVKVNRERLNKLLEAVDVPDERKGLLDWMKEELDKFTVDDEERQVQLQKYLDKCKGFEDTRQAVEDFFDFITDWEEIKKLCDEISEKLRETLEVYSYYSFVNEERYERAVLDVQLLSVATGIGAVTKIKKVKDILIGLRNFTKAQWDDLGRRFGDDLTGRLARENWNGYSNIFVASIDEIAEATTIIKNYRVTNNLKGKNCGYLEGNLNGNTVDNKMWLSGEAKPDVEPQIFTAIKVDGGGGRSWLRNTDSEYKMLNKLANDLGGSPGAVMPKVTGELKIVSELEYCSSCQGVIQQFNEMFPNIKLILVDGAK